MTAYLTCLVAEVERSSVVREYAWNLMFMLAGVAGLMAVAIWWLRR